jgi:hypothetical protein
MRLDDRPNYTCPDCGGFVREDLDADDLGSEGKYDFERQTCEDCEYTQIAATWGGAGEREVWGSTIVLEPHRLWAARDTYIGDSDAALLTEKEVEERHPGVLDRLRDLTDNS